MYHADLDNKLDVISYDEETIREAYEAAEARRYDSQRGAVDLLARDEGGRVADPLPLSPLPFTSAYRIVKTSENGAESILPLGAISIWHGPDIPKGWELLTPQDLPDAPLRQVQDAAKPVPCAVSDGGGPDETNKVRPSIGDLWSTDRFGGKSRSTGRKWVRDATGKYVEEPK